MIHILIAEDNTSYRKLMKIHLNRAGYQVFEANDGEEALEILEHETIHLLIADIMMPNLDGFNLTEQIRQANYTMPILIVSAKSAFDDKREGFSKGADDYMTKPIDMDEMLLRVQALLRRANISEKKLLTIHGCVLNEDSLQVTYREMVFELRQKEFGLLHKLLSYPNQIFTRQSLMDEIWGMDSETDSRTVDVHIKRLREKLADVDVFEIQTIRGLGYKAVIR
ncbi:MAG: response regulator transcription factor [Eubacterium sp.]|nr:response regulator transcription factor [Eubacterium sp.]